MSFPFANGAELRAPRAKTTSLPLDTTMPAVFVFLSRTYEDHASSCTHSNWMSCLLQAAYWGWTSCMATEEMYLFLAFRESVFQQERLKRPL